MAFPPINEELHKFLRNSSGVGVQRWLKKDPFAQIVCKNKEQNQSACGRQESGGIDHSLKW